MRILIWQYKDDWRARFDNHPTWKSGRTIPEAIGNLVIDRARELNFEIEEVQSRIEAVETTNS